LLASFDGAGMPLQEAIAVALADTQNRHLAENPDHCLQLGTCI